MRVRKTVSQGFTPEIREHIILMDFLGQLNPAERKLAKKHGLLKWDGFIKEQNRLRGRQRIGSRSSTPKVAS